MDTTDQAANGRSFGKGLGLKKSLMTLAASVMLATSAQALSTSIQVGTCVRSHLAWRSVYSNLRSVE